MLSCVLLFVLRNVAKILHMFLDPIYLLWLSSPLRCLCHSPSFRCFPKLPEENATTTMMVKSAAFSLYLSSLSFSLLCGLCVYRGRVKVEESGFLQMTKTNMCSILRMKKVELTTLLAILLPLYYDSTSFMQSFANIYFIHYTYVMCAFIKYWQWNFFCWYKISVGLLHP